MTTLVPLVTIGVYVAYAGLVYAIQGSIIFPKHLANSAASSGPAPRPFETWWRELEGEAGKVEAWFAAAPSATPENPRPAVIYFHGNGELIEHSTHIAAMYLEREISVLLVEYRGYGRSGGKPSEASIREDGVAFAERLRARPEVDALAIIYHGRSLGGGAACAVARNLPPRAMILESTFESVRAMSRRYLLPGFVCRHPFRNDVVLGEFEGPVLLMHGSHDSLIPPHHSKRLHAIAPDSTLELMSGGHNDFPRDIRAYEEAIDALLERALVDL